MQFLKIVGFVGFLASAHAHFLLNYPQTRGFDEDQVELIHFLSGPELTDARD
jgi:hypothetical protein